MSAPLTKIDNLECDEHIAVGGVYEALETLNLSKTQLKIVDTVDTEVFTSLTQTALTIKNAGKDYFLLDVDAKALTFQPEGGVASTYASDHLELVATTGSKATLSSSVNGLVLTPNTGDLGSAQLNLTSLQITYPDGLGNLTIAESGIFLGYPDGGVLQLTENQINMVGSDGKAILYVQESILKMVNADDSFQQLDHLDGLSFASGAKKYSPSGVHFGANSFDITADGLTIQTLAGTAGQVLASSGAGVAPVWADLPSAYVNPLKMFNFAIPSAPQSVGTIAFSALGDARVFTVPPAIMLMVSDATGNVVPVSLNGVNSSFGVYDSFGWVASSAVSTLSISVYSLG